jgi:uncharacterized iron-regulated membrane protein
VRTLRRVLFWVHLSAGLSAGVVIVAMSATGALLAFKPQILNVVERSVRTVTAPVGQPRIGVEAMLSAVRAAQPEAAPVSVTIDADRSASAAVALGRDSTQYVDPYTGRVLGAGSIRARAVFRALEDWHRWLGASAANRTSMRAVTGACNLAFLALAVSGLYLWWPRTWTPSHTRAMLMFRRSAAGRARDFNWHNVIGFWCAPVLIVLTLTGVVMSYPWANNLLFRLAGSPPPAAAARTTAAAGTSANADRTELEPTHSLDQLWWRAEQQLPEWRSITMRLPDRRDGAVSFSITNARHWNAFARSQLTLAASGEVQRWAPYESIELGAKLRGWGRFAHTGELGGLAGQTVAAIACVGAVVLAYTGFALAVRRLVRWRTVKFSVRRKAA